MMLILVILCFVCVKNKKMIIAYVKNFPFLLSYELLLCLFSFLDKEIQKDKTSNHIFKKILKKNDVVKSTPLLFLILKLLFYLVCKILA